MKLPRAFLRAIVVTAVLVLGAGGCTMSPRQYWQSLKGEGFPEWSESLSSGVRSGGPQPSGFFTDRRSEQIEQHLGGF